VIAHVILFTPRPDVDARVRTELADALRAATEQIDSIRRARIGRRVTRDRAYERAAVDNSTHVVILEFDDEVGLQTYLDHPAHARLTERFFTTVGGASIYDFELEEGPSALDALVKGSV